jgi:hypothetical protein
MRAGEYATEGPAGDRRDPESEGSSDETVPWYRRHWTTIVLEECAGGWRATQTGVAAEGHGDTAADAAAAYCRRIARTGEERIGDDERETPAEASQRD